MPWDDRLQPGAYISPAGVRYPWQFENVSKTVAKRTAEFNFPDANGTYVQDNGHTGRRYPLTIFFWGDNHDKEAEAFEAALLERGTGTLEHPLYGTKRVVPFGDINQRDDLKTAANQSVIQVTFFETIDLFFPVGQTDPASIVLASVDAYRDITPTQYTILYRIDNPVLESSLKNEFNRALDVTNSGLADAVADQSENIRSRFDDIYTSITSSIDLLVGDPLTLVAQTLQFVGTLAAGVQNIAGRLAGYGAIITRLITGNDAVAVLGNDARNTNDFYTRALFATASLMGQVESVVNTTFETKIQALTAAEIILDTSSDVTDWWDDNMESLDEIDTGEIYQAWQEAVAVAAGFLVEISFSLKQERTIILDAPRSLHELAAELYGDITDETLNFLINTNALTGDEILEIPRGRRIVYFI